MPSYPGKAISFTAPGEVQVVAHKQRPPRTDEVLVQTLYSVISPGAELLGLQGTSPDGPSFPTTPDGTPYGRVVAVGRKIRGTAVGDLVLARHGQRSHGTCRLEEVVAVPPRLPSGVAAVAPLACPGLRGVRRADLATGGTVLVVGLGLVGQFTQQLARLAGADVVVAVDPHQSRRERARRTGLTHALDPKSPDFTDQLREIVPGGRFSTTFDTSGSAQAIVDLAVRTVDQGRIILVGATRRSVPHLSPHDLRRTLTLVGADEPPDGRELQEDFVTQTRSILELVARGDLHVEPLISHCVPVGEAPEMYRLLSEDDDQAMGVVLDWSR